MRDLADPNENSAASGSGSSTTEITGEGEGGARGLIATRPKSEENGVAVNLLSVNDNDVNPVSGAQPPRVELEEVVSAAEL